MLHVVFVKMQDARGGVCAWFRGHADDLQPIGKLELGP